MLIENANRLFIVKLLTSFRERGVNVMQNQQLKSAVKLQRSVVSAAFFVKRPFLVATTF